MISSSIKHISYNVRQSYDGEYIYSVYRLRAETACVILYYRLYSAKKKKPPNTNIGLRSSVFDRRPNYNIVVKRIEVITKFLETK